MLDGRLDGGVGYEGRLDGRLDRRGVGIFVMELRVEFMAVSVVIYLPYYSSSHRLG
jgi:hypothetical protein